MTFFPRQAPVRLASRVVIAATFAWPACVATGAEQWESSEQDTLRHSIAEDLTGGVRVEDIVEPTTEYHFASFGKPDPFAPPPSRHKGASNAGFDVDETATTKAATTAMSREESLKSKLQKYNLKDLTIVGMWRTEGEARKALILTPEGQGITVQENDPITPGGKIARIEKDKIIVRVYSMDMDGTQKTRDESLAFNKGQKVDETGRIITRPGHDAEFIADKKSLPDRPAAALPALNAPATAQKAVPIMPPAMTPEIAPPAMPASMPAPQGNTGQPSVPIPLSAQLPQQQQQQQQMQQQQQPSPQATGAPTGVLPPPQ